MRSSRPGWHSWHKMMFVAAVAAGGCGGTTSSGSGASGDRASCESDVDCAVGVCVDGECTSAARGGAGGLGAGGGASAAAGAGTVGGGGAGSIHSGCAGTYVHTSGPSTGGAPPEPPTCAVDAEGYAAVSLEDLCDVYRCPSQAADLVKGLDCSGSAAPGMDGISIASGCGFETVTFSGTGFTYEATFDTAQGSVTAIQVQTDSLQMLTDCYARGFKAGAAPASCESVVVHTCVRPAEATGSECRDPRQNGCATCCTPWVIGSGCQIATSLSSTLRYDYFDSQEGACPCSCRPCAECTTETEYHLRTYAEKAECECPPVVVGTGGTTGTGGALSTGGSSNEGSPCEQHCGNLSSLASQCPDVQR